MKNTLTKGHEGKAILMFMLPLMAGSFLQQLYNTIDSIVIGNFASQPHSLAAIATSSPISAFFVFLAVGFSAGGSVVVSQFFGAKKEEELKRSISTLLIFTTGFGLVMTLVGIFGSEWILQTALGVDGAILPVANTYMILYSVGLLFSFIYNGVAAVLRALGNSSASLIFLIISTVANILLDLLFIVVFHWGVAGAAIATTLAQLLSAAISIVYLYKKYGEYMPQGKNFVFDRGLCRIIVKMGLPNALQFVAIGLGSLLLQRVVNGFGPLSMEAFLAGSRLESLTGVPATSFTSAILSFTAQNTGAGEHQRVKRGLYYTLAMNVAFMLVIIAVVYAFAPHIVRLFGVSEAAVALGVAQVRFVTPFMAAFALYSPVSGLLRGAGDATMATILSLLATVVRVGGAYLFVNALGYHATWFFLPIGWCVSLIIAWCYYFSGHWKNKSIIKSKPKF